MAAVLVGAALLWQAHRWYAEGRPERYLAIVLIALLVESIVYPSQAAVPVGPFRIPALGGTIRLHDLLVVVGVLAAAWSRPIPVRLTGVGVAWMLSFAWMVTACVIGLLSGNPINVIMFQMGSVAGLFGGYLLTSSCDPRRVAALFRRRWVLPLGVFVSFAALNQASDQPLEFFGTGVGTISVDTASVFMAAALMVVVIQWGSFRRDRAALYAAAPLALCPLAIEQRATLLAAIAAWFVVLAFVLFPTFKQRMVIRRSELAFGAAVVFGALLAVALVSLSDDEGSLPLAAYYEQTFETESQRLSAQARIESLGVGLEQWRSSPVFGLGLGEQYTVVRPGRDVPVVVATFDNVAMDLLVRSGAVGLVLVVIALSLSIAEGIRSWRAHHDRPSAVLAPAATAILVGLIAKAGVESILEKGKLALVLGLTAGLISATVRNRRQDVSYLHGPTEPAGLDGAREHTWI